MKETGYMNPTNTNNGGWDGCARRAWCNGIYKNAFPSTFGQLFKQFKNLTANGTGSLNIVSVDYFALPSEKELFGTITHANETAEEDNLQFQYYKTSANRIKKSTIDSTTIHSWFGRSPTNEYNYKFCMCNTKGNSSVYDANKNLAIVPFGCI